jgi:CRP-like cAMP-binding protein
VGGFFGLLCLADPAGLGLAAGCQRIPEPVPLFGTLPREDLLKLLRACRVTRYAPGQQIVREGEAGTTLFAIGDGRVIAHCRPAEGSSVQGTRVYLSSLSEGDFFGEYAFLTQQRRSATIEALAPTTVIEIDRAEVDGLSALSASVSAQLLSFYKSRVVELRMAKNPVLAALPPEERRQLISGASMIRSPAGLVIIEEGAEEDAVYFIKDGEVEVLRHSPQGPVVVGRLAAGAFFGEIAAIRRMRRTASVRALTDVDLLVIPRADLEAVLALRPEVRGALERAIDRRLAESAQSGV